MAKQERPVTAFEVVDQKTGEVVHTVDVRGKSGRMLETVEMGLMRKTDLERFFVREVRGSHGS